MGKLTIGYGLILVVMGIGWYIGTDSKSITALIPTFLGVPVILCGVLAEMKESWRMHVMHVAVLLGLIGLAGGGSMGIPKILKGNMGPAPLEQSALAVISAIFVALCVKSFIDARRRRKAREASE